MADAATANSAAAPQGAPLSGARLAILTIGLALGTFMEVLDTSIANVAVPTIAGSVGVSNSQGTWVISSYAVAAAVAVPLTGWLARRVGEARLFVSSVAAFTLASMLCGLAPNMEALVVCRLLQGLVSGPMVPLSQTILLRSFPEKKRGLALGLWAMTVIVAPIFGPVVGGWITDNYTWPWIFYINVPVGVFSAASCFVLLRGHETKTRKLPIDLVGLTLLAIGVGSLQMMLDLGKDRDWFNNSLIVTLAITAAVCLSFLVLWELTSETPIVDLTLFSDRNFALGVVVISFGFMTFFASVVIFPLWLQTVMDYTAGKAGLATAPVGLLALVLSPIIGQNMERLNLRAVASFAFFVFAGVSFWNSGFALNMSFAKVIEPRLVQGIGIACFFVPMTTITLSSISDERLAAASGLSNFFRTLSGAIGTAVSTTMWEDRAIYHHARLAEHITPYSEATTSYLDQLRQGLGLPPGADVGMLNDLVTRHAFMLATNDIFHLSGYVFLALAVLVWMTRPKRAARAALGH
ncbi:DHA2 family efflux MFS transporter permease subunit [Pandoraea nosoerga]|uniref:Multidrug resistance protein B n=1 Tax=Pandoraea nosoerga TaxID=2508296 RepID=A0A5E4UI59_9BURK|nr:DHA2 family efflux MFS transporter permease subunit [Pandoraea nosoerga]MBN4664901.1 DHA2 family efflux MFS transporter permease subunit [Pandoraea nosoerga]MBN4673925.1 DHA2 family efflux MFS transporter permease subunit [Pandoraea nosoerga]MBN4680140.1 DHA2 family efflux MFS transporter permease subunit [Pandoraea nosoerga]MBN4744148.1 DHA2 family efflux MFS transporter permease subunit [Pandoraea nosoerga]VVD98728.1 multidrug resistance protein B [Pandoraea nosoerga]